MIESIEMKHAPVYTVFLTALMYYGVILIAPNKFFILSASLLYAGVLWMVYRTIPAVVAGIFMVMLPLTVGKTFTIDLLTERDLNIVGRTFGIAADVIVSFSDIIIVCMAGLLVYDGLKGKGPRIRHIWLEILLFLYPVMTIAASVMGSVRPDISLIHSIYTLRPIIIYYFFATYRFGQGGVFVLPYISSFIIFESVIVLGQLVRHGPIGSVIEQIPDFISIDLSRDAAGLIRYSGSYPHANALANALIVPLLLLVPYLLRRYVKIQKPFFLSLLSGASVFVLTMSRSAWLGLGVGLIVLYLLCIRIWKFRVRFVFPIRGPYLFMLFMFAVVLGLAMVPRIVSTIVSKGEYGSLETRSLLIGEYRQLMVQHPIFGVGLEMDVYTGYLNSFVRGDPQIDSPSRSVLRYFPEPVHNGLLRLFIETGITGVLPYVGILILLLYRVWRHMAPYRTESERLLALSLFCSVIGLLVNSMMQPLLPDLRHLVALTMIYTNSDTI